MKKMNWYREVDKKRPLDTNKFSKPKGSDPKRMYLGVELEVNAYRIRSKQAADEFTDRLINEFGFYLNVDGGGSKPIEMKTDPLSLEEQRKVWKKLYDSDILSCCAYRGGQEESGTHIHISNRFSKLERAKFYVFINHKDNFEWITRIAGREGTRWARRRDNISLEDAKDTNYTDRIQAVRRQHTFKTLEVRIFTRSLTYFDMMKRIEFVRALADYVRTDHNLNYQTFIEWLHSSEPKDYDYTSLKEYTNTRKLFKVAE